MTTCVFGCPRCAVTLEAADGSLTCLACDRVWQIVDGVPLLTDETPWYRKDYLSAEQFEELFALVNERGWDAGIQEALTRMTARGQKRSAFESLGFAASRADFHHFLRLTGESEVLDYGCGLGSIAFGLAAQCGHVMAMDQSLHRARFIRARALGVGCRNITAVCGGNSKHLPFPQGSFDAVVLNGVLEWMPRTQTGRPKAIQQRALGEVARVLKPGGALYLGIENRFGYRYLMGKGDNHNSKRKLRYITVMPRFLADIYSYAKTGLTYRTYLHSHWQLKRMLKKAGFSKVDFLLPYPGYSAFKYISPLGPKEAQERLVDQLLALEPLPGRESAALAFLARAGLLPYFAQDFSIIARRPSA